MTSHRGVSPLFLARFQRKDGVLFRAWSPRHACSYPFATILEENMTREYTDVLQRVMNKIGLLDESFVDITTNIYSSVPFNERGDTIYFVTLRDGLFSPIFFMEAEAEIYLRQLRGALVEWREGLLVRSAIHTSV